MMLIYLTVIKYSIQSKYRIPSFDYYHCEVRVNTGISFQLSIMTVESYSQEEQADAR